LQRTKAIRVCRSRASAPEKASLAKPAAGSKGKTNEIAVTAASGSPVAVAEMLEAASERAPAFGNALSKDEPVRSDWQTLLVSTNILWSGGFLVLHDGPRGEEDDEEKGQGGSSGRSFQSELLEVRHLKLHCDTLLLAVLLL
jgi:hypothetical protein